MGADPFEEAIQDRQESNHKRLNKLRLPVWPRFYLDDGQVQIDREENHRLIEHGAPMRYYYPTLRPTLPFELAKVPDGDHEAALRFVKEWGFLGYQEHYLRNFDPLWFIWGHAATVRTVLSLWKALKHTAEGALDRAVNNLRQNLGNMEEPPAPIPQWIRGCIEADPEWPGWEPNVAPPYSWWMLSGNQLWACETELGANGLSADDQVAEALQVIRETVSDNLRGANSVIETETPISLHQRPTTELAGPSFIWTIECKRLVDVVYWHLANLLVQGDPVRRCKPESTDGQGWTA